MVFKVFNCFVLLKVDAMASAKMLTLQLRRDNIAYSLRPVHNFEEAEYAYKTFMTSDIKTIFMINCGAVSAGIPYDTLITLILVAYTGQQCAKSF